MTWLLSLATGIGIPQRFAKFAVIGVVIVLLLLMMFAAVKIHDHRVIAQHQAQQDAANSKADRKADATAAEQRRADDSRLTQERSELQGSTDHAQTDLDRRLAFQRCLRLQQSARAAKRVVPSCRGPSVPSGAGSAH